MRSSGWVASVVLCLLAGCERSPRTYEPVLMRDGIYDLSFADPPLPPESPLLGSTIEFTRSNGVVTLSVGGYPLTLESRARAREAWVVNCETLLSEVAELGVGPLQLGPFVLERPELRTACSDERLVLGDGAVWDVTGGEGPPEFVFDLRDPASPPAASCTGAVPPNSTLCPGAGSGLVRDAPRVVFSSCTTPATPCSHVCNAGFVVEGGACVAAPVTPAQFTENGDGTLTVASAAGRLTWLRDAGCGDEVVVGGRAVAGGAGTWDEATFWASGLSAGVCGLSDGSIPGDWRLPTHIELARMALDLPAGSAILDPQPGVYWSSWVYWPDKAGGVDISSGEYFDYPRENRFLFWPVR